MFKKISVVTVLSATLLFGGVHQSSVEASANANQSIQELYSTKLFSLINKEFGNVSEKDMNDFVRQYLSNWSKWRFKQVEPETVPPVKEEKPETVPPVKEEKPEVVPPVKEEKPETAPPVKEEKPEVVPPVKEEAPEVEVPQEEQQNEGQSQSLSQFEQEVVTLTNNERSKQGLSALQADAALSKVAREKSRDMAAKNYFDHNSPTYGSPFDMMKAYDISYRTAGENIARGQRTPAEVVQGWMNSPGHRENIMKADFTHIGVGFVEQSNHWTQMFIGK